MTIRQKLHLSLLLLVVALMTIAATIAYTFQVVQRETVRIAQANDAIQEVFELSLLGYEYQTYAEERTAVQWHEVHRRLGQDLQSITADTLLLADCQGLRRMHDNHALIGSLFEKLAAMEEGPEARRLVGQSLQLRSDVMVADTHQLAASSNQAVAALTKTLLFILCGSLMPLVAVCVFIYVANRRILHGLAALQEGAKAIGQGQLGFNLDVSGRDEFTALSGQMNAMAEELRTIYQQLTDHTAALARENVDRRRAEQTLRLYMEQLE